MTTAFPEPCATTAPFWAGLENGKLMIQYDPTARRYQFPARAISVRTGKQYLQWREVSGRGVVHALTEAAGVGDAADYTVALIELDEGVRLIGRLIAKKDRSAEIGTPVKLAFDKLSDGRKFFTFRVAD